MRGRSSTFTPHISTKRRLPSRLRLFDRRPRWGFTGLGWLVGLGLGLALLFGVVPRAHDFFAMNQPIASADLLIVEGWITDANAQDAIHEFRSHPYQAMVTTGTQIPRGYYLSEYKTFADLSRASLIKMGLDAKQVIAVPAPGVPRDRSYTAALAVNDWINEQNRSSGKAFKSANLLSEGTHARRSWMLYQKALQGKIQLGVIAVPPQDYRADRWWTQSEGFKRVLFESIGWVYVQVFDRVD